MLPGLPKTPLPPLKFWCANRESHHLRQSVQLHRAGRPGICVRDRVAPCRSSPVGALATSGRPPRPRPIAELSAFRGSQAATIGFSPLVRMSRVSGDTWPPRTATTASTCWSRGAVRSARNPASWRAGARDLACRTTDPEVDSIQDRTAVHPLVALSGQPFGAWCPNIGSPRYATVCASVVSDPGPHQARALR